MTIINRLFGGWTARREQIFQEELDYLKTLGSVTVELKHNYDEYDHTLWSGYYAKIAGNPEIEKNIFSPSASTRKKAIRNLYRVVREYQKRLADSAKDDFDKQYGVTTL